jgi:hypothetical protein
MGRGHVLRPDSPWRSRLLAVRDRIAGGGSDRPCRRPQLPLDKPDTLNHSGVEGANRTEDIEPRGRFSETSVDPTDARKANVRRFGRSDRSALRLVGQNCLCWVAHPLSRANKPTRQVRAERWDNPSGSSPAHLIVSLTRPREDPSVRPKTSPGASRDLGSSHSIPIGDGAVGPPRSGFVLRVCIRKADGGLSQCRAH